MIEALIAALPALDKLNDGQPKLNKHKYPALDTDETDAEKIWDSLNRGKFYMLGDKKQYDLKHGIGSLAVSQGYMTVNMCFDCSDTEFKDLKPKQQRIIKAALKCKDEPYSLFPIRGLAGGLFKIK